MALIDRYGDYQQFFATYSPDKTIRYTGNEARCFDGKAPTLALIAEAYGDDKDKMWLTTEFSWLAETAGCKDKLTKQQLKMLVDMIASKHSRLKTSEIMLFVRRFLEGHYGKFYGSVDPMLILSALHTFATHDRNDYYRRRQQALDDQRREQERQGAVSYDEYLQLKHQQP